MTDIVIESVKKLETLLEHSGCSEGGVVLDVDPDAISCRYEKGACMTAEFGGKRGVFTTFDPIRACTKISFMFGASLDTPAVRGAACAIINVSAGFFCLTRVLQPCDNSMHTSCGQDLRADLSGKVIFLYGTVYDTGAFSGMTITKDPSEADIILIGADGCITTGVGDIIDQYAGRKRILLVGPSTSGIARLNGLEHWCPYGRN